jgi:uncharacterized protein (UPF0147 family)
MKSRLAIAAGTMFPLSIPQVYKAYKTTDPITATVVSAGAVAGGGFSPDYSDPAVKAMEIRNNTDMRKLLYEATALPASPSTKKTSVNRNLRKGVEDPQAKTEADIERKKADTAGKVAVLMEVSPDKLDYEKAVELLKAEALSRGETTALSDKSGKKTSFGKRVAALRQIISERDAKKAQ